MGSIPGVGGFLGALALDRVGKGAVVSRKHHNIFYISQHG